MSNVSREVTTAGTAILILNWNRLEETRACVASCPPGVTRFILNNGCDGEEHYRPTLPAIETVVDSATNLGFAGGVNLLAAHALARGFEWLLLLNNDARLTPGALESMLSVTAEDVAAVCPMIIDSATGRVWSVGGRIQFWLGRTTTEWGGRRPDEVDALSREVDFGTAACLLLSTGALAQIDGLDTTYFAYWEETDWCTRARRAGYRIVTAPRARVRHRGGASSRPSLRTHLLIRNCILFMRRNGAAVHWITFLPALFLWSIPAWSARAMAADPWGTLSGVVRALWWHHQPLAQRKVALPTAGHAQGRRATWMSESR